MRIKSKEKITALTESFLKDDKPIKNLNIENTKKYFKILNSPISATNNDSYDRNKNQTLNENKTINKKVILSKIFPKSVFSTPKYYKSHIRLYKKATPSVNTENNSREKIENEDINEKDKNIDKNNNIIDGADNIKKDKKDENEEKHINIEQIDKIEDEKIENKKDINNDDNNEKNKDEKDNNLINKEKEDEKIEKDETIEKTDRNEKESEKNEKNEEEEKTDKTDIIEKNENDEKKIDKSVKEDKSEKNDNIEKDNNIEKDEKIKIDEKIKADEKIEKNNNLEKTEKDDKLKTVSKSEREDLSFFNISNSKPVQKTELSEFKKLLFKTDKKIKNNKSIVYKKKSIKKNKLNFFSHKRNLSMNYYIEPKFKEVRSISGTIISDDNKIDIKIKPYIKRIKNNCMRITKQIIKNKRDEISKIIYIQKLWKKIMSEKQFKPIIYDYKEFVTYLPHSFYYDNKKPYQDIINNISNTSNLSNNLNTIMSYTNNKEEENINEYYNKYKFVPGGITLNRMTKSRNFEMNVFPNQARQNLKNKLYNSLKYKTLNNINNTFSYNYSNTYNNNIYNYKSPKPSSLKIKKYINNSNIKIKTKSKSKSKNKFSIANIIIIKNKLNKWIKNKIDFNYTPHAIDKFKKLIPNKNFITILSNKKEKRLFPNNEFKDIIKMPKISKNKKIKDKSNIISNKININDNNFKKIKSIVNKNKISKINKKQKLIKKYFLEDIDSIEPKLNLENKLIMKKPNILRKKK